MLMTLQSYSGPAKGIVTVLTTALLCAGFILLLKPLFVRYALARPNARSSHQTPTPQGGGIAVTATILLFTGATALFTGTATDPLQVAALLFAALLLALVGIVDDIRTMEAIPRLALQFLAVAIVIATTPEDIRPLPFLPWWIERAILVLGGVWFVNLTNFMDGIDWLTVTQISTTTAAVAILGACGYASPDVTLVSLIILGATLGFAPFNKPVARLFLGDAGSLPLGLFFGWLMMMLASEGQLLAAALLPLYYLMDATVTLLSRLTRGRNVFSAHRDHYYQQAKDAGISVRGINGRVAVVNVALGALAIGCAVTHASVSAQVAAFVAGTAIVTGLLVHFARTPRA